METRAHGVLGGKIGRIKQSNVNPAWLADQLFAAKIIGEEDVLDARNTAISKSERREELMQLVMGSGKEGGFHTFVKILLSKEHLMWLGNEIKGMFALITAIQYFNIMDPVCIGICLEVLNHHPMYRKCCQPFSFMNHGEVL